MLMAVALVAALALPKMAEQRARARVQQLRETAQTLQAQLDTLRQRAQAHGIDCRDTAPRRLRVDGESIELLHCQPVAGEAFAAQLVAAAPHGGGAVWQLAPLALTRPRLVLERADAPQPSACALGYKAATADSAAQLELIGTGC